MLSGERGQASSVASFIKEHFNIVGNSIIFMVLLGLEKLMDLEFTCPGDKPLAVAYSLVFLVVPTIIVGLMACYLSPRGVFCCKTDKREKNPTSDDEEEDEIRESDTNNKSYETLQMSEKTKKGKTVKCGCHCETLMRQFFWIKIVVYWILIVFTDGRYADCAFKSASQLIEIKNSNITHRERLLSWREIRSNYLIHVFQIIGLLLILLVIILVVFYESQIYCVLSFCGVKFESASERFRKMNEDVLLQMTEDTLQEQARKRQKEFVVNLLSTEDWASYEPGRPDALEELAKITAKWKAEVKKKLHC